MRWSLRLKRSYRPCVGMMILNNRNDVFVARRIDSSRDAWQMPQGGIDQDESPEEAAFRELQEEIGTNKVKILAKTKKQYTYNFPRDLREKLWNGQYRGQRQTWFLMRYLGSEQDINIKTKNPEFNEWKWIQMSELINIVIPFKKKVYEKIILEFQDIIHDPL